MRDLKADMELCKNATQGPWEAGYYNSVSTSQGVKLCNVIGGNNAKFIAQAREALPYWLEKYQQLEILNRELMEALEIFDTVNIDASLKERIEDAKKAQAVLVKAKEVLGDE